jgi:hypothetical protein
MIAWSYGDKKNLIKYFIKIEGKSSEKNCLIENLKELLDFHFNLEQSKARKIIGSGIGGWRSKELAT